MKVDPKAFEIPAKETYKLDGMREVCKLLDHPELGRKSILISGTNGKGSTTAFLTDLFLQAGLKVGTYSSPHVVHRGERIRINGIPLSEASLQRFEKTFEKELSRLTYFERHTVLAFLIFRAERVDLQILEVGIGGRLDATNISEPQVSVVTTIDYDHQAVLGNTLTAIAYEKAGIARAQAPLISHPQRRSVQKVLKSEAKKISAPLFYSNDFQFSNTDQKLLNKIEKELGLHQKWNAASAILCFRKALKIFGIPSAPKILRLGRDSLWPARIQEIKKTPLWIVDGAHNENSLEALLKNLRKKYPQTKRFHLIFGALNDKPVTQMLKRLAPLAIRVSLPFFYSERQISPEQLSKKWAQLGKKAQSSLDLKAELANLWKERGPVLVVGSFYLAGAVLRDLESLGLARKPDFYETFPPKNESKT